MPEREFGSDGQLHDVEAAKQGALNENGFAEQAGPVVDQFEASEPASAAQRLRAFEDEHLGADAVRIHGDRVERGSGSLFQRLPPEKRKAHELIEKTVETERNLAHAREKLAIAENTHNAAVAAAEDASKFGG
jgi:hypothetical protein